jgi:hypothetical protein
MPSMNFLISLTFLILSSVVVSDDTVDLRFLDTQRTRGNPFTLPIRISTDGEVSFFGEDSDALNFRPTMQFGFSRGFINYSHPVLMNRFNFYPQQKDLGWLEVKRLRLEAGLGLSAVQRVTKIGLMPYKGSVQTFIRYKASPDEDSRSFRMPSKLIELESWNTNDHGTFQTYGGISLYAGLDTGIIDIALGTVGLQNQFIIEMKKLDHTQVSLKIIEESLRRRQIVFGPSMSEATFAQFEGKRFLLEFQLDLLNPLHHQLFEDAMKGKITSLQENLDHSRLNLKWRGGDRTYYVGIPVLAGKSFDSGHYELNEDEVKTQLDFEGSRLKGVITPVRNLQDFVYQKSNALLIVWSSEMNKTTREALFKRFLRIGRAIGIKGFNRDVPDKKFGSVISQLAVHISKEEFQSVSGTDMEQVEENLKVRCKVQKLSCGEEKRFKKVMKKLSEFRQRPWEDIRKDLGILLIREPAVIHALVKTMKYHKEAYFKFLSEKYQSIEGSSPIE